MLPVPDVIIFYILFRELCFTNPGILHPELGAFNVGYEYSYWWIYIGFIVRIFSALVLATYRYMIHPSI
jgi:hypothetical protein